MHLPDHYLSDPVTWGTAAISAGAVAYAARRTIATADRRTWLLMGVTSAAIFAVQMVNYPIDARTSGHVLGGALAGILLGPWAGMLTLAAVLAVQAFALGDGGVTAWGANVLNMAIVGAAGGWGLNALASRCVGRWGSLAAVAGAACGSVLLAAAACGVELTLSGRVALNDVLPALCRAHVVIGLVEAAATVAVVACLASSRAIDARPATAWRTGRWTWGGLVLSALLFVGAAPWSSELPDGLERVAADLSISAAAQ